MQRDFSVRVPSDLRAGRESGATNVVARTDQPRRERDADVRAKTLYALAEWRGRREQAGQPKLVTAAIKTLRSVGRRERGVRADVRAPVDRRRARSQVDETDEMT